MIMDVQQHTEQGVTYRVGQRVFRADYESDGTAPTPGFIERIELEAEGTSSDGPEATYCVRWLGANGLDAHGVYALWAAISAHQLEDGGLIALVQGAESWGVRLDTPQVLPAKVTVNLEGDARTAYESLRDLAQRSGLWVRDIL